MGDDGQHEINQSIVNLLRTVNQRFDIVDARLDLLEKKVDLVGGEVRQLRRELRGVIDPDFPMLAGQETP